MGPSSCMVFLGIEIDADNTPSGEAVGAQGLNRSMARQESDSGKGLKSLVGKLEHASRVIGLVGHF